MIRILFLLACVILGAAASPLPSGYLGAAGNQITDGLGNNVRLSCVVYNDGTGNPTTDLTAVAAEGFNCIRLGWWDTTLSLPTMDATIAQATARGLKVVIEHRGNEHAASCLKQQKNGLWYDKNGGTNNTTNGTDGCGTTGTITYANFKTNWQTVATHYAGNTTVVAFDLHNAPLTQGVGVTSGANWGTGDGSDARAMCNDVGGAVHTIATGALIICEGPQNSGTLFVNGSGGTGVLAQRANDMLGNFGLNTHPSFAGFQEQTIGAAAFVANLQFVGITHIRAHAVRAWPAGYATAVNNAGIKVLDIVADQADCSTGLSDALADYAVLNVPGFIEAFEPGNEINTNPDSCGGSSTRIVDGATGAVAALYVQTINNAIRGNATVGSTPVIMTSLSFPNPSLAQFNTYQAQMGNLSAFVDFGNYHKYSNPSNVVNQPHIDSLQVIADCAAVAPGKRCYVTEGGYQTAPNAFSVGSNLAIGKMGLNRFLDYWANGAVRDYWYAMFDSFGETFGMFTTANAPKNIATNLNRFNAIVRDPAPNASTFIPGRLNYSLSVTSNIYSGLVQQAGGNFIIPVWNEPLVWNGSADVTPAATAVTVNFGRVVTRADWYDPLIGTASQANCLACSSIAISLQGYPKIVKVQP